MISISGLNPEYKMFLIVIFIVQYKRIYSTDGYGATVQFDEQGDALGRYSIMNYQRNRKTRKYEYKVVGSWTGALKIESAQIVWAGGTLDVPTSQCSYPCLHGEIKNMQTGDTCCWICTKCQPHEYLKDEFTCKACESGFWPYEDKDGCYALTFKHMQWASVFAIIPMCLSCVGIIITSIVIFTLMHYNDTPVVRAAGRELSYMLLCGCLCCYVMSFILLAKPSTTICAIQRFGVGLGFAVIYSSLLTKTNRISRIFYSARKSAKRPPFISPKSQIVITSILICIQILITTVWMVLAPPGTRSYYPSSKKDVVILKCKVDDISFLVSLIYNMLLITVCTIYAIKTRKIPENFNESKFIGFAMYTTCIIWLAFIPIYFGTLNSFEVSTLYLKYTLSYTIYHYHTSMSFYKASTVYYKRYYTSVLSLSFNLNG